MGKKRPTGKGNGRPAANKKPPGCYVLSLSVENVRCFGPKQTLDCSDGNGRPRQWTVILGDNGTGKTTLLHTVASSGVIPIHASLDPFFSVRDSNQNAEYGTAFCLGSLTSTATKTLLTRTPAHWVIDGLVKHHKWERTPARFEKEFRNSWAMFGYGSQRRYVTYFDHIPPSESLGGLESLLTETMRLIDPQRWLIELDYLESKSAGHHKLSRLIQIKELLSHVLPDVSGIRCLPGHGVIPQARVEFKTDYGWVPLRQLGHGYQTMIAWVVDFVSRMVERYPESENPLAEPAVCLVDEIDLHLHPVWQRKVIGYLSEKFPNTQFIVTAHSPLVVQAAASADANIAVLVRSTEKDADGHHYVEIRNNPEDVRNWRLDQILTSDLFGGLSLNPPKVEELFKEKEHLAGLKRPTPAQKARLVEIEAELAKLPVGDDAREVKEMQAIRDALHHLQKHAAK